MAGSARLPASGHRFIRQGAAPGGPKRGGSDWPVGGRRGAAVGGSGAALGGTEDWAKEGGGFVAASGRVVRGSSELAAAGRAQMRHRWRPGASDERIRPFRGFFLLVIASSRRAGPLAVAPWGPERRDASDGEPGPNSVSAISEFRPAAIQLCPAGSRAPARHPCEPMRSSKPPVLARPKPGAPCERTGGSRPQTRHRYYPNTQTQSTNKIPKLPQF